MTNIVQKIQDVIHSGRFSHTIKSRVKYFFGLKIDSWEDTITSKKRYLYYCLNQIQEIEKLLNRNGYSLFQFNSVLDFGCGDGRLTKHLFELIPNATIYGCDVGSREVSQCKQNFTEGNFFVNKAKPPLNLQNYKFDFIFSYSIFTHLSEKNHIAWLRELAQFLTDGGVMLHTTHGYECLKRLRAFDPKSLDKYNLNKDLDMLMNEKNLYHFTVPDEIGRIRSDDPEKPEYGLSIISKDYVMNNWEKYSGIRLCDYIEGGIESSPEGCHDVIILSKSEL